MDSDPTFQKPLEAYNHLKLKGKGSRCYLQRSPTTKSHAIRPAFNKKGMGVSIQKIDDTGLTLVTYTEDCPDRKEAAAAYRRSAPQHHLNVTRQGDETSFSSVGFLEVGSSARVQGHRVSLETDIRKRGWKASIVKDGDYWIITRKS